MSIVRVSNFSIGDVGYDSNDYKFVVTGKPLYDDNINADNVLEGYYEDYSGKGKHLHCRIGERNLIPEKYWSPQVISATKATVTKNYEDGKVVNVSREWLFPENQDTKDIYIRTIFTDN